MVKMAKKVKSMLLGMVIFGAMLPVGFQGSLAIAQSTWSFVTIPDLPSGATLGRLWTDRPGNLYVWAGRSTPPEAFLYHWNGESWSQVLHLPAHNPAYVFGTGSSDVFASAYVAVNRIPKMYHFDGTTWTEQLLPANLVGTPGKIVGEADNIYFIGAIGAWPSHVIRHNGTIWQTVTTVGELYQPVYINKDEIYVIGCWGHSLWNGNNWNWFPGFDFCDVYDAWGMRDTSGILHLYAIGNNNFANGVKVWKFTETYPGSMTGSWGSKYETVFSDPPGYGYQSAGTGIGIWGSGPNDIYIIGACPVYSSEQSYGRVYHYNGTDWERITVFGDIFPTSGVWGTGSNDVWITTGDRLLHYGPINQPPVVTVPGNMTVEATGASGAVVTFSATANDDVDGAINPTCTPASGSTFPFGETIVTCTATDSSGNEASAYFTVTVRDRTAPLLTVPADITVAATGASGAVVTFSASATDLVDGSITPVCVPPSGSTFIIGTTTVNCTATDNAGNSASSSFEVIVNKCPAFGNEVAGMIKTLIANVAAINLKKKEEKKLIHELDKALKEMGQCDQKNACKGIEKFIKDVQKKKLDKHFEPSEEAALLLQANAIRVKLGCS